MIIVVSDIDDGEVRRCLDQLRQAELQIEVIPDVYAATAKLALGVSTATVLVDARTLDDKELAFLRLVPRFFPRCDVVVPAFPGLQDRAVYHSPGVHTGPAAEVIAAIIDRQARDSGSSRMEPLRPVIHAEESPVTEGTDKALVQTELDAAVESEETWESASAEDDSLEESPRPIQAAPEAESVFGAEPDGVVREEGGVTVEPELPMEPVSELRLPLADSAQQQRPDAAKSTLRTAPPPAGGAPSSESPGHGVDVPRLSTDGGPEDAGSGPSMHEVVRRRMAADQSRAHRRTPPRHPPEGSKAPAIPNGEGSAGANQEANRPPDPPPAGRSHTPPPNPEPSEADGRDRGQVEPMLSPDELDALLAGRDAESDGGPPWTDTRGER